MKFEIEDVFKVILMGLIVLLVGSALGNPQTLSQQFTSLQVSAPRQAIRPARFRARQANAPVQRGYYASKRQR